jgi:hypothetical protein
LTSAKSSSIRGAIALVGAALLIALVAPLDGDTAAAHASSQRVGTITLSPRAVTLSNPVVKGRSAKAARIAVSLIVLDAHGKPITKGTFSKPIGIQVYAPSLGVLTPETSLIRSPKSKIYFDYTGGYVANSILVTAVSGHAFSLMSFQPKHRGFAGTGSVTFPISSPARNIANGWGFMASVGGGRAHYVQMDTGSRGVIVPTSVLGKSAVGPGAAGQITYTSDGKEFLGHYYLAALTLSAGGKSVTTVPIQVLGVDKGACAPKYPKCVPPTSVSGLGMIGVGFDRGSAQGPPDPSTGERPAPPPAPSKAPPELTNPFLALTSVIQGSMHPGYVISSKGVTLGITSAGTAGFKAVRLAAGGSGPGDWNTEPGCFSFPSISGYAPQCGTVLVDTGIDSAILGLPTAQRPSSIASSIPDGEHIQIQLPTASTANAILSYSFATGDTGNPMAPTSIRWAAGTAPFVNTGRDPISRYDYLFDAGSGKVGFRPA